MPKITIQGRVLLIELAELDRIEKVSEYHFQDLSDGLITDEEYVAKSMILTDFAVGAITLKQLNDRI